MPRLGFGAMRLPGKDVWGEPPDRRHAIDVVRRAIELGVRAIDTAWYYGPFVANEIIAEAIHPYPRDVVLVTKLGGKRMPDESWAPFARPEELRQGLEHDLRTLRIDTIDVVHLRFIERSGVPFLESLDAMLDMKKEGKLRHVALSAVSAKHLAQALERTAIASVSNIYNVAGGGGPLAQMTHSEVESPEAVLDLCRQRNIPFLPYFPLAVGNVSATRPALVDLAKKLGATPAQVAIAWLLARSPVVLPIPGTSSVDHVEENWKARTLALDEKDVEAIARA